MIRQVSGIDVNVFPEAAGSSALVLPVPTDRKND